MRTRRTFAIHSALMMCAGRGIASFVVAHPSGQRDAPAICEKSRDNEDDVIKGQIERVGQVFALIDEDETTDQALTTLEESALNIAAEGLEAAE